MGAGSDRGAFSERDFYLAEFQGRTIAIAAPAGELADSKPLCGVLDELAANRTRVVLLSDAADALAELTGGDVLSIDVARLEGEVWRALRQRPAVGVALPAGDAFLTRCGEVTRRLAVTKLVWLDALGGVRREDGERRSFVALAELATLLEPGASERRDLLLQVESVLRDGVPAVNVCTASGLADELFTYAGSGTLFTRDRYVTVRRLGIDDFDAAAHLVALGVAEGYLVPRSPEALDAVLAGALGAFVEGRHLAGIGALIPYPERGAAEIVSLYTLTRFVGEGVGAHLVAAALERARDQGLRYAFACTTSERVVAFFERCGFRRVADDAVPPEKWGAYDPGRRASIQCVRCDLDG